MSLIEQLNADFTTAYKEKDMVKKNFLAVVKGAIQTNESKGMDSSVDDNVLKVIKQFIKNLNESIEARKKLGVDESELVQELSYLEVYLPAQMSNEEIKGHLISIIEALPVKNVGAIMGKFNVEHKGKYFDNKVVGELIKELL